MGYYVYKHTSPSGKIYIGITQQRPTKRWGAGYNYDYNDHFFNAIRKYGWDNFSHEILFSGLSREEAKAKEIELIAFYDSANRNKGYNVSPGGEMQSDSTKKKIQATREALGLNELQSIRSKARWEDPEFRAKTLANMRGKVRSAESRERYRQATLRRGPLKPESVEKMRAALRTKKGEKSIRKRPVLQIAPVTLEVVARHWTAREAASAVGTGMNYIATTCRKSGNEIKATHGFFWCYEDEYDPNDFEKYRGVEFTERGTVPRTFEDRITRVNFTDEVKQKMSKAHSRSVVCVETGEVFGSVQEAATKYGVHSTAIGHCLRGKAKTSAGYHWVYSNDFQSRT